VANRIKEVFENDKFFSLEKIYPLFHVKRINKAGKIEQNTYLLAQL